MSSNEASWTAIAQLFGRLLVRELDEEMRAVIIAPPIAAALLAVGIDVSVLPPQEELDAQFFSTFIQPESGGPLVQSLWVQGTYEGDSAVAIRKLAEVAGADFDREAARGAPHDHLGCILLLWAELRTHAPEVSEHLEQHHIKWAIDPLTRIGAGSGFYSQLASALIPFLNAIVAEAASPDEAQP